METLNKQTEVKDTKEVYEKPQIEVIEMEMEGILCMSGDDLKPGGGSDWF